MGVSHLSEPEKFWWEWQNPLVAKLAGKEKYAIYLEGFQLSPQQRLWLLQQDGDRQSKSVRSFN